MAARTTLGVAIVSFAAVLASPLALPSSETPAGTDSAPDSSSAVLDARTKIQQLYKRFDDSYTRGDFADIQAFVAPDAWYVDELTDVEHSLSEQINKWKALHAEGTTFSFQPATVLGFQLSGLKATATVRRQFEVFASGAVSSTQSIAFRRDDWVLTSSGWKLKNYGVIGQIPAPTTPRRAPALPGSIKLSTENLDFTQGASGDFPLGWKLDICMMTSLRPSCCRLRSADLRKRAPNLPLRVRRLTKLRFSIR